VKSDEYHREFGICVGDRHERCGVFDKPSGIKVSRAKSMASSVCISMKHLDIVECLKKVAGMFLLTLNSRQQVEKAIN
jgi:adenylosuccinate synthase